MSERGGGGGGRGRPGLPASPPTCCAFLPAYCARLPACVFAARAAAAHAATEHCLRPPQLGHAHCAAVYCSPDCSTAGWGVYYCIGGAAGRCLFWAGGGASMVGLKSSWVGVGQRTC